MKDFVSVVDDLKVVFLTIAGLLLYGLHLWRQRSKTGVEVNADSMERRRFVDAIANERIAIEKANGVREEMGGMQRRMGGLESENKAQAARIEELEQERDKLEKRIGQLEHRIDRLMSGKTLIGSDFKPGDL